MNEKRYTVGLQSKTIFDMKTELYLFDNKIICELLNAQNSLICEQQALINELKERNAHNFAKKMQLMKEIKELKAKLREKEEDEKLYANEIVELRKTNEEWLQFKELGGDY